MIIWQLIFGHLGVSLEDAPEVPANSRHDVLAIDEALNKLEKVDLRKSQVVELRFFGGLSVEETASLLLHFRVRRACRIVLPLVFNPRRMLQRLHHYTILFRFCLQRA